MYYIRREHETYQWYNKHVGWVNNIKHATRYQSKNVDNMPEKGFWEKH